MLASRFRRSFSLPRLVGVLSDFIAVGVVACCVKNFVTMWKWCVCACRRLEL